MDYGYDTKAEQELIANTKIERDLFLATAKFFQEKYNKLKQEVDSIVYNFELDKNCDCCNNNRANFERLKELEN